MSAVTAVPLPACRHWNKSSCLVTASTYSELDNVEDVLSQFLHSLDVFKHSSSAELNEAEHTTDTFFSSSGVLVSGFISQVTGT